MVDFKANKDELTKNIDPRHIKSALEMLLALPQARRYRAQNEKNVSVEILKLRDEIVYLINEYPELAITFINILSGNSLTSESKALLNSRAVDWNIVNQLLPRPRTSLNESGTYQSVINKINNMVETRKQHTENLLVDETGSLWLDVEKADQISALAVQAKAETVAAQVGTEAERLGLGVDVAKSRLDAAKSFRRERLPELRDRLANIKWAELEGEMAALQALAILDSSGRFAQFLSSLAETNPHFGPHTQIQLPDLPDHLAEILAEIIANLPKKKPELPAFLVEGYLTRDGLRAVAKMVSEDKVPANLAVPPDLQLHILKLNTNTPADVEAIGSDAVLGKYSELFLELVHHAEMISHQAQLPAGPTTE